MSEPTIDFPDRPSTEQQAPNLPGIQSAYLGPASSASASATGGGGGGGVITTAFPGSPTDGERFTLTDSTSAPTWYQDFVYNATIAAWLGIGSARGTSFPAVPVEGMEAILTDSLAAPTLNWSFWYSTAASKWLFIGGSYLSSEVATAENVTSSTYVDLATVGPSVSISRAGVYDISFGAYLIGQGAGPTDVFASPKIGSAATADADAVHISVNNTGDNNQASVARTVRKTCAAADVVKIQYRANSSSSSTISNRWMKILPVAVT